MRNTHGFLGIPIGKNLTAFVVLGDVIRAFMVARLCNGRVATRLQE
jgi:hypothetical protein